MIPKVLVSAKAILIHKEKILILKEKHLDAENWDLPGGKLEYGESPEVALVREVQEETGLTISDYSLLGTWFFISPQHHYQVVCITYVCPINQEIIDITHNPADENIVDFKWVSKSELLSRKYPFLHDSVYKLVETAPMS